MIKTIDKKISDNKILIKKYINPDDKKAINEYARDMIEISKRCEKKLNELPELYGFSSGIVNLLMDNSVDYNTYFSELSIREFWTKCNIITRILYK